MAVSFGLELLVQPLPHPFAAFGQNFYLNFMQRARFWGIRVHISFLC
jgi:hypothetical protein